MTEPLEGAAERGRYEQDIRALKELVADYQKAVDPIQYALIAPENVRHQIAALRAERDEALRQVDTAKSDLAYQTEARVLDAKDSSKNFSNWRKEHHDPLIERAEAAERQVAELREAVSKILERVITTNMLDHSKTYDAFATVESTARAALAQAKKES